VTFNYLPEYSQLFYYVTSVDKNSRSFLSVAEEVYKKSIGSLSLLYDYKMGYNYVICMWGGKLIESHG